MHKADAASPLSARSASPLSGTVSVPGDKSVSHRALILGALSVGETRIAGLLEGEDVLDTAKAMRAFGAEITREASGKWVVHGVGTGGFAEPENVIDCGNSGTGVRLIMGAMASTPITTTFTGDASLRNRPMGRVTEPLALFGAQAHGRSGGRLPLTITGSICPIPVQYAVPVPSAQVKSALLLGALNAPGVSEITEAVATRDHTERMLRGFGAELSVEEDGSARVICLRGQTELNPVSLTVPGDPSSAAFPICAALMIEGSDITVRGVGLNPTRTGLYTTLQEMGADLVYLEEREEGGEPVADIRTRFSALSGVEVPRERAASMIDEFPILAALAATAEGRTVMRGVKELRLKESDRIAAMARGLEACGVVVEEAEDMLAVEGRGTGGVPGGCRVTTHLDHRIAMSFLCLGLSAKQPVEVDDAGPIATSFPNFLPLMEGLGAMFGRPDT